MSRSTRPPDASWPSCAMLVDRYSKGCDDVAQTPDQIGRLRVAQHAELGDPFLAVDSHTDGHDGGKRPVTRKPAGNERSQALYIQLRPGSIFIVAEGAVPAAIRTCPKQSPVAKLGDEGMRVQGTKRSWAPEDRLKLSLHGSDDLFDRRRGVEVGDREAQASALAELNHERSSVPALRPAANEHRASHREIPEHRIDQPQPRVLLFERRLRHTADCRAHPAS